MKYIFILLLSSITLFANVGKITAIKGDVKVQRDLKSIVAKVGFILILKDKVVTSNLSRTIILLNDNTSITVGKNSKLSIDDYVLDVKIPKRSKATFGFSKGIFRTITGKIGKLNPSKFKLKTKSATIGIRGSDGTTLVNENGEVRHVTNNGRFFLTNNISGKSVEIPSGFTGQTEVKNVQVVPTSKKDLNDINDLSGEEQGFSEDKLEKKDIKKEKETLKDDNVDEFSQNKDLFEEDKATVNEGINKLDNVEYEENNELSYVVLSNVEESTMQSVNTQPVIQFTNNIEIQGNAVKIVQISAIDPDSSDVIVFSIVKDPSNGSAKINPSTGVLTYSASDVSQSTVDAITLQVDDGKGGVDTKVFSFTLITNAKKTVQSVLSISPNGDLNSLEDSSKISEEIVKYTYTTEDTYLSFGYWTDDTNKVDITKRTDTYVSGISTPNFVIEDYVSREITADYTGKVASFVTDADNIVKSSGGNINLKMDFKNKSFDGIINIEEGNWKASINSGDIFKNTINTNNYEFKSTDITSTTTSSVNNITGNINGGFYGSQVNGVGGKFNLTDGSSTVNGVFGATKVE